MMTAKMLTFLAGLGRQRQGSHVSHDIRLESRVDVHADDFPSAVERWLTRTAKARTQVEPHQWMTHARLRSYRSANGFAWCVITGKRRLSDPPAANHAL